MKRMLVIYHAKSTAIRVTIILGGLRVIRACSIYVMTSKKVKKTKKNFNYLILADLLMNMSRDIQPFLLKLKNKSFNKEGEIVRTLKTWMMLPPQ